MRPNCLVVVYSGENQTAHQRKYFIPTVRHGGGWMILWVCTVQSLSRPWSPLWTKYSRDKCQVISDCWSLAHTGLYHRAKKHNKSTREWQQKKRTKLLQWPRKRPDFSPSEMLWQDLKRAVKEQISVKWRNSVKQSGQQCERLIKSYRAWLFQVVAAKGGSTRYWIMSPVQLRIISPLA